MTDPVPAPDPAEPVEPVKASPAKVIRAAKKKPAKKAAPRKPPRVVGGAGQPLEVLVGVAERRRRAWEMKLAGADNVTIGRSLTVQGSTRFPPLAHGYNGDLDDEQLATAVRSDLRRALNNVRDETSRDVGLAREQMIQRHFRALAMVWGGMSRGDPRAHAAGLGHMRAIAKLGGYDEPTRLAVTGDDPDVKAALDAILARMQEEIERGDGAPTLEEIGEEPPRRRRRRPAADPDTTGVEE